MDAGVSPGLQNRCEWRRTVWVGSTPTRARQAARAGFYPARAIYNKVSAARCEGKETMHSRQIQVFIQVADSGSFASAAEKAPSHDE